MADLLLELFSEEIPARMQARAAADLERLVTDFLKEEGLGFAAAESFAGPRRLTLSVRGLPLSQPDRREERKGPKVGAPEKALEGFLRSTGLSKGDLEIQETPKGQVYFAVIEKKGLPTAEVLAATIPEILKGFPWPKSMRWGAGTMRWVRPLHAILCVLDGVVVPFAVEGVESGAETRGHRFMGKGPISVRNFEGYRDALRAQKVILDGAERKALILKGARAVAAEAGLELIEDAGLLEEVTGLVEWPVPLLGRFDEAFLQLPEEVLTTSMRSHQKYFACRKDGKLANAFVVIANLEAPDGGAQIRAGNERVLRARLSDGMFFWEQDLKVKLEDRLEDLKDIVFHAKLGTLAQKVERVRALAKILAPVLGAEAAQADRAAQLAKADLVTNMVYEFPEVQGVMGGTYARLQGEPEAVARAITEHYQPAGAKDDCPRDPVSLAVSIADKLDTLVGFWAIDEKPTGSKDPYALRRAALGIIRMVLENGLRLPLSELSAGKAGGEEADLLAFFADRLKVHLKEEGIRHDLIDAVFALPGQDDLWLIVERARALQDFLGTEDGANLLAGFKRAVNILRIEEKKDARAHEGTPDPAAFAQAEETALFDRIAEARAEAEAALEREDFAAAMGALAKLRAPVDAFFDHVTVNADDPALRENRLKLLSEIRAALHPVADFSKIEG